LRRRSRERDAATAAANELRTELRLFLKEVPHEDPETGLGNLRHLEREWARMAARWQRHGEPFALGLLMIGDPGTPEWPETLRQATPGVVRTLVSAARAEDSVCQLGERAFVALLAGATYEGGLAFVERARYLLSSQPMRVQGLQTYLLMTVGVAEWSESLRTLKDLLNSARRDHEGYSAELARQHARFAPVRAA
jgi:GGDEF domain-containing protein